MGYFSYNCLVCGRDLMSKGSSVGTPAWMKESVVFMPDDIKIAGEYTGFGAVKTEETGTSLIMIDGGRFLEKDDDDHGALTMHMWRDHFLYNPCCYHRACWEAVGSPEGYRAASLPSNTQGSGLAARLYGVRNLNDPNYGDDANDGPLIGQPSPGPEALNLWAINAIVHFFHILSTWAAYDERAEDQREMWRGFARTKELFAKIDTMIAEDEKP